MPTKITQTDKKVNKARLRNELAVLVLCTFIVTAIMYAWTEGVRKVHTHIVTPVKAGSMPGLNFTYFIHTDEETNKVTLVLYDQSAIAGGLSLTNSLHNAVEHVCVKEGYKTAFVDCVYCDTEGRWDGWDPRKNDFILLGKESAEDAIEALKQPQ